MLHTVGNLVCGDAYLIDGQSNALATDTGEESPRERASGFAATPVRRAARRKWVRDRLARPVPHAAAEPVVLSGLEGRAAR